MAYRDSISYSACCPSCRYRAEHVWAQLGQRLHHQPGHHQQQGPQRPQRLLPGPADKALRQQREFVRQPDCRAPANRLPLNSNRGGLRCSASSLDCLQPHLMASLRSLLLRPINGGRLSPLCVYVYVCVGSYGVSRATLTSIQDLDLDHCRMEALLH